MYNNFSAVSEFSWFLVFRNIWLSYVLNEAQSQTEVALFNRNSVCTAINSKCDKSQKCSPSEFLFMQRLFHKTCKEESKSNA